ncbi:DoxX family protein [Thalassoglobus sp.]|uniref:DoxX family protein n=1 Tax=Thalassoglobus sp. TaxID=2795869 RepID=UPI003AA935C3
MINKDTALSTGLLILRVAIGGFMLIHGYQKLAGFSGLANKFPDPLGIGSQMSLIAAIGAEVGCSLLLILGLGTRLAALPLAFTMIIALFVIHGADPWQRKELAAIFLSVYAAIVFTGPGRFSLDHSLWGKKSSPARSGKSKA